MTGGGEKICTRRVEMVLTKEEQKKMAEKNIDLGFDYLRQILDNPEILDNLPDEAYVVPIPIDDEWLMEKNWELAKLRVKEGEVIKATAKKGEDLLKEILKIENANRLGEFAIGTNYGITEFTKNMLFDEKLGGTLHCALGLGFEEIGSKNKSAIHWDILKDMKIPGSKVIADGKIIYEEGKWKIEN